LTRKASEVHVCDLEDPKIFSRWGAIAESVGARNYHVSYQDARNLKYPGDHFDLVYSISVIEHIPDDGDTRALEEFRRVLKPGGVAIVEVPYRKTAETIYARYDSKGAPLETPQFYERHYDDGMLRSRLEIPGLRIRDKFILAEYLAIDPWIAAKRLPKLLRIPILPIEPWLAAFNMRMNPDDSKNLPLAALMVYQKDGSAA
jgi:SAM-dependent methyltransferase